MTSEPPIEAVLFDCDGTLVDSERLGCGALVRLLRPLGLELTQGDALCAFAGRRMEWTLIELAGRLGRPLPEDFAASLRAEMERAFERELQPVGGARELLETLRLPCAVASGGPRQKTERNLARTGLLRFFEGRIFSSYDVLSWKPDPGLFLHAAAAIGVEPARCAVVEDSIGGVRAGVAAGMRVFALEREAPLVDLPAQVCRVRELGALAPLLARPGGG